MVDDVAGAEPEPGAALAPSTLAYLDALAAASFKRQEDLDESVWRSLPFFAAALALAVTIVSRVAASAPLPTLRLYPIVVNVALVAALLSFGWALRWFYDVLRPRTYGYPPPPAEVRNFAYDMARYYAPQGAADADPLVVDELRQMMIAAHASATRTNFLLNEARLEARGQLILFLMAGFLMTLASEAIIYTHDLVGQIAIGEGSSDGRRSSAGTVAATCGGREAGAAKGLHVGTGSQIPALERDAQASPEIVTGKAPPATPPPLPQKPAPPPSRRSRRPRTRRLRSADALPTPPPSPSADTPPRAPPSG